VTASSSCAPWLSPASTRWPAPPSSCWPKKHTTCLWASPAWVASSTAPARW